MSDAPATLLFVDDEPSILSALRRLFRPHGYRILTAESGREGLATLEKEHVDAVVSDMRMPEMDGAAFLEQVRQRWPDIVRILLTGYADVASTIAAINRGEIYRYVSKPWDDKDIELTVRDALEFARLKSENARLLELTRRQNEELRELNAGLEQKVAERTAELQETLNSLDRAHKQLHQGFMSTVRIFAGLIELRGGKLAGHSRRVAELARQVAQAMGFDEKAQQDVLLAGLLHDIGKISLSDDLLNRPFNALPPEQQAVVMRHPAMGQQALMGVEQLANAAKMIRHHHECMDGSGFPDRLAGLAIPVGARILAVANDYDALQMGALTLQAMTPAKAYEYIQINRGQRYDPMVVDAFKSVLTERAAEVAQERAVRPAELRSGMVLARDLMHPEGYLLLPRGRIINSEIIEQLEALEQAENRVINVFVQQEGGPAVLRDAPKKKVAPPRYWKELALSPAKLKPGMTLSRKLLHKQGYLLLAQGQRLDELVIDQLQKMEQEAAHLADHQPMVVYIRIEDRS